MKLLLLICSVAVNLYLVGWLLHSHYAAIAAQRIREAAALKEKYFMLGVTYGVQQGMRPGPRGMRIPGPPGYDWNFRTNYAYSTWKADEAAMAAKKNAATNATFTKATRVTTNLPPMPPGFKAK